MKLPIKLLTYLLLSSFLLTACSSTSAIQPAPEESSPTSRSVEPEPESVSLEDLDPELVRPIAFQQVRKALINSKTGVDRVNHVFDDGINLAMVNKAISMIPRMSGFFEDVGQVEKFTIIWTTKNGSKNVPRLACEEAGYCEPMAPEQYCNLGELQYLWVFCGTEPIEDYYLYPMFHGYVHIQQYAVSKANHMPTWFGEGTASYFEGHFAALHSTGPDYTTFGNSRSHLIRALYENQKIVKFEDPATEQNVIDALRASSNRMPQSGGWEEAQLGYYLGFVAVEALIASYGLETFKDFWKLTADKDFYQAFEVIYGLSTNKFYKKLAPYAVEMMKRGG